VRPPIALMKERRLANLDKPVLAFVANLHPQKNHRGVIHAFAQILRSYPKARLKIVGARNGNETLLARIDEDVRSLDLEGAVEFLGPLDRRSLSRVLTEAHLGLLPTHLEGFSIVTLEYAFFGLPSILSDTGAARWLAREHGHALLAPGCALPPERLSVAAIEGCTNSIEPTASKEIADAVVAQLEDYPTWLEHASAAAERFATYSFEARVDRYIALIEEVLGGDNGGEGERTAGRRSGRGAVSDRP
jgi:glycosyltransferase involved in cell wall biosynthesis